VFGDYYTLPFGSYASSEPFRHRFDCEATAQQRSTKHTEHFVMFSVLVNIEYKAIILPLDFLTGVECGL
jgi:hypothetical protein